MKRAQASVEYLMVVGLAFVIVMPMVYMFYSYTISTQEEVGMAKIHKIGVDMANAAEGVYYLGEPSRTTISVNMPELIYNVTVLGDYDRLLVFYYGDVGFNQPIVIPSKIPLDINLDEKDFSPGRKALVIEARPDGALIRGET